MQNIFPDSIRCIAIFSPAGLPDVAAVEHSIALLKRGGINVKVMPHAFGSAMPHPEYLAATDHERAEDFMNAYLDEETDMLLASRGGYGCGRILDLIDWQKLAAAKNKIVAGYSDLTALFFAMSAHNCGTPLASVMAAKFAECSEKEFESIWNACSEKERFFDLEVIKPGISCGTAIAGNLTVAASCAGTEHMPDISGKILFIEDINEECYKIDRMLGQLKSCNILQKCSGLVAGYFTGCKEQEIREVLSFYSKFVNGPVLSKFPYGHELPFEAIKFGQKVKINGNTLSMC